MKKLKNEAAFWRALRGLRGLGWKIDRDGRVRCAKGDCPIVAVAKANDLGDANNGDYDEAWLGLIPGGRRVEATTIAVAADYHKHSLQKPAVLDARDRIIKTLGLSKSK